MTYRGDPNRCGHSRSEWIRVTATNLSTQTRCKTRLIFKQRSLQIRVMVTNHSTWTRCKTGLILKWSLTVLNRGFFSFPRPVAIIRSKNTVCPTIYPKSLQWVLMLSFFFLCFLNSSNLKGLWPPKMPSN